MPDDDITFLGETTFRNERKRFGIKNEDRRRHIYIIGKTGTGKSELLINLAFQDIKRGYGIGFFDPYGESAERLLDLVPKRRINEVVYFNPADENFPIPFNIFERVKPVYRYSASLNLLNVFRKIWTDVWSAKIEYILENCILALLDYPNSTILGIYRLLVDSSYRKAVIDKITDPMVKIFWTQEFPQFSHSPEAEAVTLIKNKISKIIHNPLLRNILGQTKSKIDFKEIINGQKVFIANLSRARLGEDNSAILGLFLSTKVYLALLSRIDIPAFQRRDFYLYLDEFQNFASKAFISLLSEAAKYRLCLILANQYLKQLGQVKDAVLGNVGTIISFRLGAEDAEYLAKEFSPEFSAEDFVNLAKFHIYLKLMVDGVVTRPFSGVTLPPVPKPERSYRKKIISVSRERYAVPKKVIEEKLGKWTGF